MITDYISNLSGMLNTQISHSLFIINIFLNVPNEFNYKYFCCQQTIQTNQNKIVEVTKF